MNKYNIKTKEEIIYNEFCNTDKTKLSIIKYRDLDCWLSEKLNLWFVEKNNKLILVYNPPKNRCIQKLFNAIDWHLTWEN